jgi:hypothetical protein
MSYRGDFEKDPQRLSDAPYENWSQTESVFNGYDIVDTNDRREAMRKRAAAG